jgi:hypothetical protein
MELYRFSDSSTEGDIAIASAAFKNDQLEFSCNYPARTYLLLRKNEKQFQEMTAHCEQLNEFLGRVPLDNVSIVFASEQSSQPASAMGHLFLRLTGTNLAGEKADFGLSFATSLNTYNVVNLAYETLLVGRKGSLQLNKYQNLITNYVDVESRKLWQADIKLTNEQKRLLQLHVWELKQAAPYYHFVRYNCATFLLRLIAAISPDYSVGTVAFLTPLDVYRYFAAKNNGIQLVHPADEWLERTFRARLTATQVSDIEAAIISGTFSSYLIKSPEAKNLNFTTTLVLAQLLNHRYLKRGEISAKRARRNETILKDRIKKSDMSQTNQIAGQVRSPLLRKPDSQIEMSFAQNQDLNYAQFRYLPAAFRLGDDQGDRYTHRESRLGEITFNINESGDVELQSAVIAAFKAFTPVTDGFNKFSWTFDALTDRDVISNKLTGDISFFTGKTLSVIEGIAAYGLLGGVIKIDHGQHSWGYQGAKVGLLMNQAGYGHFSLGTEYLRGGLEGNADAKIVFFDLNIPVASAGAVTLSARRVAISPQTSRKNESFRLGFKVFF